MTSYDYEQYHRGRRDGYEGNPYPCELPEVEYAKGYLAGKAQRAEEHS